MHSVPKIRGQLSWLSLFVIIAVSLVVNSMGLPLPAGLHPDELGKVDQVLNGQYNFLHPLLLLHAGSITKWISGITDPVQLLDALRFLMLGFSALALITTFLLAGEYFDGWLRLGVVVMVASTPIFAHHTQYLKEDIVLLPWLLGGLWATLIWRRKSTLVWALIAGVFLGLACASKYIAVLLVFPLVVGFWRDRKSLAVMLLAAIFLFLLLMLPAVLNSKDALRAIGSEIDHGKVGHWLRLYPWVTFFSFHFSHNLIPGGGWIMILGGFLASILLVFKKGPKRWNWVFLCAFAWLWYTVHELSPSKPYIGGIRYMLPLLPILALCFMELLRELIESNRSWANTSVGRVILPVLFCFVVFQNSFRTFSSLFLAGPDPRVSITLALAEVPDEIGVAVDGISALQIQKIRPHTQLVQVDSRLTQEVLLNRDLFVTSRYYSERFVWALNLPFQPDWVAERGNAYISLLKRPTLYIEGARMPMPSYRQLDVTVHALSPEGVKLLPVLERKLAAIMPESSVTLFSAH